VLGLGGVGLLLAALGSMVPYFARAAAPPSVVDEMPPARVGQIILIGNERTRQDVILRQVQLYPGQVLSYPDLKKAEENLARLGIFKTGVDGKVHASVKTLDNPMDPDNPYKDIMVDVREKSIGSVMAGLFCSSQCGLTRSIVLDERKFAFVRSCSKSFESFVTGTPAECFVWDVLVSVQEARIGALLVGVGVNSDAGLTGSIRLNERNFDILHPPTTSEDILIGRATNERAKDVLIRVQEAKTGSLLFGVGVNSDSGLTGSIRLDEKTNPQR
jgi:outer membrane protein assembly factor BamA